MGQRLLLVDSDRGFLKEHQVSLESAFDLEVAPSPEGVIAKLESGTFAAVLICVEVADNKGYALCSTIRKHANLDGVKVMLISAKATEEEYRRHQSLKGRADLYLHKPIPPSALVAALTPFVPGKVLDPDNPLGELADTEVGDDWLEGLKNALDKTATTGPSDPIFGVRSPSLAKGANSDARPEAAQEPPPDSVHVRLLEEQIAALQAELRVRDQHLEVASQRLLAVEAEAQQAQRQLNSVTLNLDELDRSNRESEHLKARLAETESILHALEESRGREGETIETLKAQLKEALVERTDLIGQVEALNHQVGEKTQRVIELLKERDRLLNETIDLEPFRAKAHELESALAAKGEVLAAMQQEKESILVEHESALLAKRQELEASFQAQSQLSDTLEGLVEQHTSLAGAHQATLLELEGCKEKIHSSQLEMAGLEATMRGQGRDLVELSSHLRQREADLEASQAQILERDLQLFAKQEAIQQHQEEVVRLEEQVAGVRQELDKAKLMHEGERLELMKGLEQMEGEISRLNQALTEQKDACALLEQEKQAVQNQLSEHRDRLQHLDGLLQDIQDKLRHASDVARG
jgi:chromosome segregation ATPase